MVRRAGFSLVEMIVAMLLLSIAMLAIAGSALMAARMLQQAQLREQAAVHATSVLDSLAMSKARGIGTFVAPQYQLQWSATTSSVGVHVSMTDGSAFDLQALP